MNTDPISPAHRDHQVIGRIFNTPVTVAGSSWIPITQVIGWVVMSWVAGKRRTHLNLVERTSVGAITMPILLGSEWCHNLAHVYAANAIGKPSDELRVIWGMPRCVYKNLNDPDVTPRQHIVRSLGGPIFNLLLLPFSIIARDLSKPGTTAREAMNVAVGTNVFLSTVSLLPIPGIDGGAILKWGLVERGHEPTKADEVVRKTNGLLGVFLAFISGLGFKKGRRFLGLLSGLLAIASLGIFTGWIKEEELPF